MSSGIVKNNSSLSLKNDLNSQKLTNNPDCIIDFISNKKLNFTDLDEILLLINSNSVYKNDCLLLLDKIRTSLTIDKKLSLKDKNYCCLVERNIMKIYLKLLVKCK